MHGPLLARSWLGPLLLVVAASGCQVVHPYRPVAILARDAETKQPIAEAEVRLSSPLAQSAQPAWDSRSLTAGDGLVHLHASASGDTDLLVAVTARGYLSEEKPIMAANVHALKPAHFFEAVDQRPADVVVELYAEPRPTVDLVLPLGYRGLVKAEVQAREDSPSACGQRCFSVAVPADGVVQVVGPPVLRRVWAPDFQARYADGSLLSRQAKEEEVGFWWLYCDGRYHTFVVGTQAEFNALRHSYEQSEGANHRSAEGGKKGGGGGRRRRGGGDSSSSDSGM